ncbi:hypothetical protein BGZ61DRAFT_449805 [Ilyonectria robusta]|uniref:uncharacterized protein n=1 Tax=Ilyonectria robusta TaxID=1079257 RepID=UPI001E8E6688|nr:uncharacterized protein BGZ61DRAFT_449805 [Ilyonectria robusta]KAH8706361.1 hypothetical protein BGZ61DRAFT_449805 [Ilyonectria robusta]
MAHLVMAVPHPPEVAASHGLPMRRGRYQPMTTKIKEFSFRSWYLRKRRKARDVGRKEREKCEWR